MGVAGLGEWGKILPAMVREEEIQGMRHSMNKGMGLACIYMYVKGDIISIFSVFIIISMVVFWKEYWR